MAAGSLVAYRCDDAPPVSVNPRTGFPCRALLLEAWAPEGAVIRKRCKQCGAWKMVHIASPQSDDITHQNPFC
jgi:hypothetical protein